MASKQSKEKFSNFYAIFVGLALVMFWRGAWGLMDMYIFPDYELNSYIASIILSLVLLFVIRRRIGDLG